MAEYNDGTILSLIDEEGVEREFELMDTIELGDERYVAVAPIYDDPEEYLQSDGDLVVLKVVYDEPTDEEVLVTIEDDEEFYQVADVFQKRFEEYADDYEIDIEDDSEEEEEEDE